MRHLFAAALAAAALAGSAAAQEVPIIQSGAGGRFERQIDAKTRSEGFGPPQVAAFRGAIAPIIDQLAAMPAVSAPPAPLCHRLKSWIELINPHGVMGAEIAVMAPINFQNGRCNRMTGGGVLLNVNMPSVGLNPNRAVVRGETRAGDWYVLPFVPSLDPKRVEFETDGDRHVALTHGRAPLFRPVSMERYQRQIGDQAPLAPAQRAAPACMTQTGELRADAACPASRTLVELNPDYFDRTRPADVQLVILSTPAGRYHGEDDAKLAARTAVWNGLDRAALAARVR